MQQVEPEGPAAPESALKIVVIDDDPTGSQTVHSCPLLLRWDPASLAQALRQPSPLLFLLANTRALAAAEARQRLQQICRLLRPALAEARAAGVLGSVLLVSRGDSTLRGHFPLEVEVIAAEMGPFEATFLVPAFLEGGRTTLAGVHRLHGQPIHETAFARDGLFGYCSSYLPDWVQEKSGGRIASAAVQRLSLAELEGPRSELCRRLEALEGNVCVAVDATQPRHLSALAAAVRALPAAAAPSGRFLFQSAAGLISALAALPPQPRDGAALAGLRRRGPGGALPGLVLVGSHVPLADRQLALLLAQERCAGVEVAVARIQRLLETGEPEPLLAVLESTWLEQLRQKLEAGLTPVLYTSRGELRCRDEAERRRLGLVLAACLARLVAALAPQLGYVISKGGITTHTLLADGFDLAAVQLQGQLLPGLSLVLPAGGSQGAPLPPGLAGLPILTFPGNLGDAGTLRSAWRLMQGPVALAG